MVKNNENRAKILLCYPTKINESLFFIRDKMRVFENDYRAGIGHFVNKGPICESSLLGLRLNDMPRKLNRLRLLGVSGYEHLHPEKEIHQNIHGFGVYEYENIALFLEFPDILFF